MTFEESYQGSGAQSRAIVEGFDADIAALSLEADINRIADAGLITHDWKDNTYKGMVSELGRGLRRAPGQPQGDQGLGRPGQARRGSSDPQSARPAAARSGTSWRSTAPRYAATSPACRGRRSGGDDVPAGGAHERDVSWTRARAKASPTSRTASAMSRSPTRTRCWWRSRPARIWSWCIPRSTILIENPVALIDSYVDKHGNREAVEAFVEFLFTPEAQRIFADIWPALGRPRGGQGNGVQVSGGAGPVHDRGVRRLVEGDAEVLRRNRSVRTADRGGAAVMTSAVPASQNCDSALTSTAPNVHIRALGVRASHLPTWPCCW